MAISTVELTTEELVGQPTLLPPGPFPPGAPETHEDEQAPAAVAVAVTRHRRRLIIGWAVLFAGLAAGFHGTVSSVLAEGTANNPQIYLFLVPVWALIAAVGTQVRRGVELNIHDRQIDWILALGPIGAALAMVIMMVRPHLGVTAELVRLDVLALLLFMLFGAVLIFGARATGRFWATWLLLACCWPLVFQLVGPALGGTPRAYALMNGCMSTAAVWIAVGGTWRKRTLAAVATLGLVGGGIVVASKWSPLAEQLAPAGLAPVLVLFGLWWHGRGSGRTAPVRTAPVARPRLSYATVVALGIVVGIFGQLVPGAVTASALPAARSAWAPGVSDPAGWQRTTSTGIPWASRYFGAGASLVRTTYVQAGAGSHQLVVADALETGATDPLSVYPTIADYELAGPYVQSPHQVSLGHQVEGTIFYANPYTAVDPVQTEWVLLTWTVRLEVDHHAEYQRMSLITTDGTPTKVAIPSLVAPWTHGGLRNVGEDIVRGLPTPQSTGPTTASVLRLAAFGRSIVGTQLSGAES